MILIFLIKYLLQYYRNRLEDGVANRTTIQSGIDEITRESGAAVLDRKRVCDRWLPAWFHESKEKGTVLSVSSRFRMAHALFTVADR